jgi:hypothetical protein
MLRTPRSGVVGSSDAMRANGRASARVASADALGSPAQHSERQRQGQGQDFRRRHSDLIGRKCSQSARPRKARANPLDDPLLQDDGE